MNLQNIKNSMTQTFGRTSLNLQKHSPEILLGAGIIGLVGAIYLASQAGRKVDELLVDTKLNFAELDMKEAAGKDIVKEKAELYVRTALEFGKLYAPTVGLGVLSISAILASHGVMVNRQVSLVAAYNLLAEGFKNYRDRVVEELGEEVDRKYYLGLRDEKYTETEVDEEGKKTKVKKVRQVPDRFAPSVYSRFFDESNSQYRGERQLNKAFLLAQQNYANDVLILRGHLFLNEVYERLGFPHTQAGSIVGWVLKDPKTMRQEGRDGYVSFGLEEYNDHPATQEFMNLTNPTVLLDFNVDGIIWNLI